MAVTINADTSNGLVLTPDTSGEIKLQSAGADKVTVKSNGNVGIGTTTPTDFGATFKMVAVEGSSYGVMQSRSTSGSVITEIMASPSLGLIGTRSNHPLVLRTNDTERVRIDGTDFKFNSGYGSVATAYGCRAWVNFKGTGTVSIRGSGNVSSITDLGSVGQYRVNFTTAMPDTNYAVLATHSNYNGTNAIGAGDYTLTPACDAAATTYCNVASGDNDSNVYLDALNLHVAVFR